MDTAKVMIVDDESQARRVLRLALIARGFEVTDARSGEEALDSLRRESPNVILLDLTMPGIGGPEIHSYRTFFRLSLRVKRHCIRKIMRFPLCGLYLPLVF